MANPYDDLFTAVRDRMIEAGSAPFTTAAQIEWWPDEATDMVAPSERLVAALTHPTQARALISYGGGRRGESAGGGGEFQVQKLVTIRFGGRGAQNDTRLALLGDGTNGYWGILEVLARLERRLVGYAVGGTWDQIAYESDGPIPLGDSGKLAHSLTLSVPMLVTPD